MMRFLAMIAISMLPTGVWANDWRSQASPFDIERIDAADSTLATARQAALANGVPGDIEAVEGLSGPSQPIEGEALIGDWRCRTIKMGGNFGSLTVYGWFKCRVSYGPDGLLFEKLSGSQRTSGYLRPIYPASGEGLPERYIYLGAAHYGGDPQRDYGGPANQLRRVSENRDDPGILEAIGRNHLRIGFPLPVVESDYNYLELKR